MAPEDLSTTFCVRADRCRDRGGLKSKFGSPRPQWKERQTSWTFEQAPYFHEAQPSALGSCPVVVAMGWGPGVCRRGVLSRVIDHSVACQHLHQCRNHEWRRHCDHRRGGLDDEGSMAANIQFRAHGLQASRRYAGPRLPQCLFEQCGWSRIQVERQMEMA